MRSPVAWAELATRQTTANATRRRMAYPFTTWARWIRHLRRRDSGEFGLEALSRRSASRALSTIYVGETGKSLAENPRFHVSLASPRIDAGLPKVRQRWSSAEPGPRQYT